MKTKIEITHASAQLTAPGHWKVKVDYFINGEKQSQTITTTDSQAIGDWNEATDNYPDTGRNFIIERCFDFGENVEITFTF